ncbi:MAG: hypothetical protein KGJ59_08595 [Bacteroidota bacterium]|nr:hypothetical protein [Bacteroidota bacterium]
MNTKTSKVIAAVLFVLLAAMSRLLPHPANFTPIAAMALFSGVYLERRFAFVVPIAAMLISDYFLGFYTEMIWVYGSFLLIAVIGLWLKNHKKPLYILGGTLGSSMLFFVVTNFGVWVMPSSMYPKSFAGLVECYTAAIPFFRSTVEGDVFFVAVLFGLYELVLFAVRKLWAEEVPAARS